MLKKSLAIGIAALSVFLTTQTHAVENQVQMNFSGQPTNLPIYSSAQGTMSVSVPGGALFGLPADHTMTVRQPGGGFTTVFTPSSTAVPTRIAIFDQRTSTSRNISARCLNPVTLALEPCDFGNTTLFPRTNYAPGVPPYTQDTQWTWFPDPTSILQATTPGAGNIQSNGGYISLPPYVREITITAYGSGDNDFSGADIFFADAPSISKAFAPTTVVPGGQTTLTIAVKNPGLGAPIPGLAVTDVLPAPLTVVSATHTCSGGTLTAAAGANTINLNGSTLPTDGCQITAVVAWPGDAGGISACTANPIITNRIAPSSQFSTAIGQLDTEAVADLNCSYTPPVVSVACTPSELFDSPNQVSTCTITSSTPAGSSGLIVNLTPPAANPRYTTSCSASVTIPEAQTTAQCTIDATANTVAGDGDVTATLAIAAPNSANDYTIGVTPAQVLIKNDDESIGITPQAVPTLGEWQLILLGTVVALLGMSRYRRREI